MQEETAKIRGDIPSIQGRVLGVASVGIGEGRWGYGTEPGLAGSHPAQGDGWGT